VSLIIGIDPGSRKTGFGIISQVGSRQEYVTSGVIRLESFPTFPERLDNLYTCLMEVIGQWSPQEAAIEQVFMGRSASSALKLGQARGAAIAAVMQASLPVFEYSARQVKQAVVGRGGAEKGQVAEMVKYLLGLEKRPQEDAADALAIALCHAHMRVSLARMGGATAVRNGRIR